MFTFVFNYIICNCKIFALVTFEEKKPLSELVKEPGFHNQQIEGFFNICLLFFV